MANITRLRGSSTAQATGGMGRFPVPSYSIDPIESAGSLMLIEPTHPYAPWAEGVPGNGASVRNLLRDRAALAIGSSDPLALDGVINSNGLTGSKGRIERTSKGGVHAILSTTASDVSSYRFQVCSPAALFAFLKANPGHQYYHSIWGRVTRPATPQSSYTIDGQLLAFNYDTFGHNQTVNAPLGARPAVNVNGPMFRNAGTTGTGTMPATYAASQNDLFNVGNTGVVAANYGRGGSRVFYRAYVEDLTVSGRTYEQVDAIDYALFVGNVLTEGGRMYADSFTDPVTIP